MPTVVHLRPDDPLHPKTPGVAAKNVAAALGLVRERRTGTPRDVLLGSVEALFLYIRTRPPLS
jgi:hypothetical protein